MVHKAGKIRVFREQIKIGPILLCSREVGGGGGEDPRPVIVL